MPTTQKMVWSAYSGGVAALTALISTKAIGAAWHYVTGQEPPKPNDPRTPPLQAVSWVVLASVGIGLASVLVNRMAARRWSAYTGEDAPGVRTTTLHL